MDKRVICFLLLFGLVGSVSAADITSPGDTIQGYPNDDDWPAAEPPAAAIDDNVNTKYLHFKGDFDPDPGVGGTGFRVTPSNAGTIVDGLSFTTANDGGPRDPVAWELSGSNGTIDGPYALIASGDIVDFALATEWPRFTINSTPITFENDTAYAHYQVLITAIRDAPGTNSMQVAEVELLGQVLAVQNPFPADGVVISETSPQVRWTPSGHADSHVIYFGTNETDVTNGTGDTNKGDPFFSDSHVFPNLTPGIRYYWRVDGIAATNSASPFVGEVWSFLVADTKAIFPIPADGASNQFADVSLSWTVGIGAINNQVFIGTTFDQADTATIPAASVATPPYVAATPFPADSTVYWRIDTVTGIDYTTFELITVKGDVWSFTTIPEFDIIDPNLRGWWALDGDSGPVALDQSGHVNHGELQGDLEWVDGYDGGALEFDGDDDWVECGDDSSLNITGEVSMTAWIRLDSDGADQKIGGNQNNSTGGYKLSMFNDNHVEFEIRTTGNVAILTRGATGGVLLTAGDWYHVAGVYSSTDGYLRTYVNAVFDRELATTELLGPGGNFRLGRETFNDIHWFDGLMDDVRVYNKALAQEDIELIMRGDPNRAHSPIPAGSSTIAIDTVSQVSWSAGDIAASHDVYLGTDEDAVKNADTGNPMGVFKANQITTSYPLSAVMGQTYYWRVDERNTDSSITTGRVWRFTVADYRIVDNFEGYGDVVEIGVDGQRIWFVWLDGLGYSNPVAQVGNGTGSEINLSTAIAADGQAMEFLYNSDGMNSFSQATTNYSMVTAETSALPITANWTSYGAKALHLQYRGYEGSDGSLTAGVNSYTVTAAGADIWGNADQFHFAYVQMTAATKSIVAKVNSLDLIAGGGTINNWCKAGVMIRDTLDAGSPHVFNAITPGQGASFQFRPVVDLGSSNNDDPNQAVPVWLKLERDGAGAATASWSLNGTAWTQIGDPNTVALNPPFYVGLAVTSHNVNQTVSAMFSDVEIRDFTETIIPLNFTNQDIGIVSNMPDKLFVQLSDGANTQTVYHPDDPDAILTGTFQDWDIALTDFAPVNPANVQKISVGVGLFGATNGTAEGSLFVDNIRLYRPRYIAGKLPPWGEDLRDDGNGEINFRDAELMFGNWLEEDAVITTSNPGTGNLLAKYTFENNANDVSGGGNHGTTMGGPMYTSSMAGLGMAIDLSGTDQYVETDVNAVDLGIGGAAAKTVSAWILTEGFNNGGVFEFGTHSNGQDFSLRTATDRNNWRVQYWGGGFDHDFRADTYGKWVHISVVYDGTTSVVYVNGSVVAAADRVLDTTTTKPLRIGTWNGNDFMGLIDEVAVYGRALSQAEVAYLAGQGAATHHAPIMLLGNLSNDEAAGSQVINFKDMAVLLDTLGAVQVWPTN